MRPEIAEQRCHYSVGLDLGMRRDHAAIAVVETAHIVFHAIDPVTWQRKSAVEYTVRHLERIPLETRYTEIAHRVRSVTSARDLVDNCTVVMDATGLGAPVYEMLKSVLRCQIKPVVITAGDQEVYGRGQYHLPKKDLITGVEVMLALGELRVIKRMRHLPEFMEGLRANAGEANTHELCPV